MSAGVFLPPTPTCFTDSQKTLYYSIFQSCLTPSSADPCLAPSLSMPPSVPEESVDGHPPSPPRATITLGLGLINHIRRFRTSKSLKAFGAALRLPLNRPTSSEFHIVAADILQHLVTTKPTISVAGVPFNGTIGCRSVNAQILKDWSSTRQASRKESDRGSHYVQDVIKLHSKHS